MTTPDSVIGTAAVGQVRLQRHGAMAHLTLSHPGKLHAMTRAMWRELRAHALALQQGCIDASSPWARVRCVVVRGDTAVSPPAFCAGGDISEYPEFRFDEAALRRFHEDDVWGALSALLALDVPLVAHIDGACMGAGMEIASCCDLRVAAASARFGAPIAKLGFPMAPREAQLVARAAGELTAREMLLAAAVLDAPTMLQRGFLNAVWPDAELEAQAAALVQRVTALAPQAARLNKQTLRTLASGGWPERPYAYADSAEHREGVDAFLSKRPAQF